MGTLLLWLTQGFVLGLLAGGGFVSVQALLVASFSR